MKTAILGAGAMGTLIGAHLKKGGEEVWLVDPYARHMEEVGNCGVYMEVEGQAPEYVPVDGAATEAQTAGLCDAVVLLCKCVDTEKTLAGAKALFGGDTILVTMQNGVGNVELLEGFLPPDRLGFGVLKASATLTAPGRIAGRTRFSPGGCGLYFSPVQRETPYLKRFERLRDGLNAGGLPTELTWQSERLLWDKLYLNVLFNLPCALVKLAGEDFMRQRDGQILLEKLAHEFCQVAQAKGLDIDEGEYWRKYGAPHILGLPKDQRHYTSAVIDAARLRQTEVEFITGAVVREGERLGVPTPYNETIYRLVKVMENTYGLEYKG